MDKVFIPSLESTESGSDSSINDFGKGNRPLSFGNMFDGSAVAFSCFRASGNVRQTVATRQTILFERCSTVVTIRVIRDHGHVWWHACVFGISHARQIERFYRVVCMFRLQDVSKPDVALLLQIQLGITRLCVCMLEFCMSISMDVQPPLDISDAVCFIKRWAA